MLPIFPGMDPYLEDASLWPDFHDSFLFCIREALQPDLPQRYYAQLKTREEVGIGGVFEERTLYPDVSIRRMGTGGKKSSSGFQLKSHTKASNPTFLVVSESEPLQVSYLEIRDAGSPGKLVTLIEMLSPSNKEPGPDREAFERKQQEILSANVNWIEIDLLRNGRRIACDPKVGRYAQRRGFDYLVTVSRSTRRKPPLQLEVYGFMIRSSFPNLSIPLRDPDPDVLLNLGKVFKRTYETGPYTKVVRYDLSPDPPLPPEVASWAHGLFRKRRILT